MSVDPVTFIARRSWATSWDMQDERAFIAGLGRWGQYHPHLAPKREDLLGGYLEGLELRTEWCGLDREALRAYAEEQLATAALPSEELGAIQSEG